MRTYFQGVACTEDAREDPLKASQPSDSLFAV